MADSVPLFRRLEYARGYLELGLIAEAEKELKAISAEDWDQPESVETRLDFHLAAREWNEAISLGRSFVSEHPGGEKGWISWAYALRELDRIEEAKEVLLRAESLHGTTCGLLHYNLACYFCLLRDTAEAARRLALACRMEKAWRQAALDDPDLRGLRDWVKQSLAP